MASKSADADIDRLYQLPPDDFTRERNDLAKSIGGDEGKRIKALPKPSASAWAVNQLYWRDRATYDALVTASERLRSAHRAVLAGRSADLRAADAAHRDAVNAAMSSTLRLAKDAGQNVSSSMQMEIARTLQALPADEPPGRLAKPLRPGGFEALQGMPIRARAAEHKAAPAPTPTPDRPSREDKRATERERKEAQRAQQQARRAREEARRAQQEARKREQRARAEIARLRKRLAAAEKKTARAKAAWDKTQAAENKLRTELTQAERSA